MTYRNT